MKLVVKHTLQTNFKCSRVLQSSIPNGLLNAVLAEAVSTGRLDGIPQSHEADGALVFTL